MTLAAIALIALSPLAHAGSLWLQNDDMSDTGEAALQMGFIDGECWASVYVPDPGDYPFTMTYIDMLVGNDGDEGYFTVVFYELAGTNISTGTALGSEEIYTVGSTSMLNRVTISELELSLPEIESGNIGISVCLDGHSGLPAIARDIGMNHADRNYIYGDVGLGYDWYTSQLLGVNGDWIMRLCISGSNISGSCGGDEPEDTGTPDDTDNPDDTGNGGDTGYAADFSVQSITPTSADEGTSVDVIILGAGFEDGADVRIGGMSLTGTEVVNDETIQGRTPSALPVGVHDVEVILDNGDSSYLASAFTIEKTGCGCSASPRGKPTSLVGLLGLLAGLLLKRRRS